MGDATTALALRQGVVGKSAMGHVFISHVVENAATARELAGALEEAGYTTWFYERDSLPCHAVLIGITHEELRYCHREWVLMFGPAAWLSLPPDGVSTFIPRLVQGLKSMGVEPTASSQ